MSFSKRRLGLLDGLVVLVMLIVATIGVMEETLAVRLVCVALFLVAGILLLFSMVGVAQPGKDTSSTSDTGAVKGSSRPRRAETEKKNLPPNSHTAAVGTQDAIITRSRQIEKRTRQIPEPESLFAGSGDRMATKDSFRNGKLLEPGLLRHQVDIRASDSFDTDFRHHLDNQGPKGEFDFLLGKILALAKEVLLAHSVALFWANREKNQFVLEVKLTDSTHFTKLRRFDIGEDVISQIALTGKAEVISHISHKAEKDILRYYEQVQNIRSFVGVPLFFDHDIIAVLIADSRAEDEYGLETVSTLSQFTKLISALIKSHNEKYDLRRDSKVLLVLDAMSPRLRKDLSTDTVADTLLAAVGELVDWDHIAITLYDREYEKWIIRRVVSKDKSSYVPEMTEVDLERSLTGSAIKNGSNTYVGNLETQNLARYSWQEDLPREGTFIAIPINSINRCYGAISVECIRPGSYSKKDVELLQHLATGVAPTVELLYTVDFVKESSFADEVTGLYNRNFLFKRIKEELERTTQLGGELSLVVVSIDDSDTITERHGMQGHDMIISQVAGLICKSAREFDVVGKYDSHRFVALLIHTNMDDAYIWTEKLRRTVASHILSISGKRFSVTLSAMISKITDWKALDQIIGSAIPVLEKGPGNTVSVL
jgi:diguanylate cyclase (GGDEF)-like protein